jgi:hypothetical protein
MKHVDIRRLGLAQELFMGTYYLMLRRVEVQPCTWAHKLNVAARLAAPAV